MALTALCAVVATLRVLPNRSQFFKYEPVSLSCEQQGNSSEWMIMRNRSMTTDDDWLSPKEKINDVETSFDTIYPFDSGVYWCESAAGECSETVNITVTGGSVILQSQALPVKEGDNVTLQCSNKMPSNSSYTLDFILGFPKNHTADFFKNGVRIGSSSTGNMTIQRVSRSDEGFYKCSISGVGQSPNSWLSVQESGHHEPPDSPVANTQLPVVVCLVLIFSTSAMLLICLWRKFKGKCSLDVPYTDVTTIPGAQPNRTTDVDAVPTFYSTLKLPGIV